MKFTVKNMSNAACFALLLLCAPILWAGGGKDKIETVTAEGGEVWGHDFDVAGRKKGLYNYIVYARDRAGNEAVSGAFNVHIDPNAGLPVARIVYPENNAIIRQDVSVMGVASGRYGVQQVLMRLDDGEYTDVTGTEYWNRLVDFSSVPDGKHTLYIHAIDSKGVAGPEQALPFILDTTAPVIDLVSHSIGDIISGTTTLRGVASDPNGIRSMEYSADGVRFHSLSGRRRGKTAFDFSLPINSRRMPDGPLVYYLRAIDTTGAATVSPCLLFVTNSGPELELFTPAVDEDVFGDFLLSGRVYASIGISRLYYQWGNVIEDIPLRSGDPFWYAALNAGKNVSGTIKLSAVDKAGNVTTVSRKLEDRRKVKVPVLVIDYPSPDALKAMQKGMPADTAIYGHIAPGVDPASVELSGWGSVEALSAFRIDPRMIPPGKRAQTLKLVPFALDSARGAVTTIRYLKQEALVWSDESDVTVTYPEKNTWVSGDVMTLRGNVTLPQNGEWEYRLGPEEDWHPLRLGARGGFVEEVDLSSRSQGPVHLELRATLQGEKYYPHYHPFFWAASAPEIQIIAPADDYSLVYGSRTVIGAVDHTVPLRQISYSLDQTSFTDLPFTARLGKAWFSYFCDFNALGVNGRLTFRITDASGAEYECIPEYTLNLDPPIPSLIVNTPADDVVITNPFAISGLAYYDVDIHGVYWRLLGPKMESLSPGPAGVEARSIAAVFNAYPDISFQEWETDQSFQIPVDFSMITDGEYTLEIYAADIYGMRSETISRTIKVSTAPPETTVIAPVITRYNQKAIVVQGISRDANGIASVSFSMDNGNTYQAVNLHSDDSWDIVLNTAAYTDGVYSAFIRTLDAYGVATFSNAMINIDNTAPELFLSYPANGQNVGTDMRLMGRVSDNITLKSLTLQIISADNPNFRRVLDLSPESVIFDTISLAGFPQGEYIVRIVAQDLADNESLVSRKIVYDPDDDAAEIAIFNPMPGEIHTGPIHVAGIVSGSFLPPHVFLSMNDAVLEQVPVDRFGVFTYVIPESLLDAEGEYRISTHYLSESGQVIASPNHTVYYSAYGPVLQIESHQDGDVITARPWLSGRAWIEVPPLGEDDAPLTRSQRSAQRAENRVDTVMVSHDNGRTFKLARGGEDWRVRMETSELPRGPQPVLVRAVFANGTEAVRRLMVYVDTTLPQVETLSPPEDSRHRDNIHVYGTAGDNYELADVDISLRPYDKFFYSVPGAIQGLYFDVKGLGATYFDVGLGLSFFNDNVRFQGQFGISPRDGIYTEFIQGGRYTGYVYGIKLLANIFYLPFDYLFGLDWAFYSMNFAIGANFSLFAMDEWRTPLYMGAIVGQWDIANINMQFFYPNWRYFRNFALYLEPELWFASSDVQAETLFRMTVGIRINWF